MAGSQEAAYQYARTLYDSGAPLFSKATRELMTQLEAIRSTGVAASVTVTTPDGEAIDLGTSGTPNIFEDTAGFQQIGINPHISYDHFRNFATLQVKHNLKATYLPLVPHYECRQADVVTGELVPRQKPLPSYEETLEGFQRERTKWDTGRQCEELRRVLRSAEIPRVGNIVAFACGTMHLMEHDGFRAERALQHALILTLRDFLGLSEGKCLARDPSYEDADKKVLSDEGITVVDDAHGFLAVDNESVVFSAYPDVPIRAVVADIARPAVMIWNDVSDPRTPSTGSDGEIHLCADPVTPRLIDIIREQHVRFDFPDDEAFGRLAIYIRKS
ncbi:hypothetical protein B0H67DRAFT_645110 [Lasiosphaeris hirsuta]|uniref:SRR1-like domain-containing protein n=1 Tax=Lasiosphaeris hirsuta TaxID=260670 RepID=A0AA40AGD9_9PEZI|nr:hypothetical protein B0H67DRAFT_645110 [Lasiosphaeris hirsuta]